MSEAPSSPFQTPFLLLFGAQTISGIGDAFRRMALTLWVFQLSGASGPAIALLTALEIVPYFCMSFFAGALVDRWPRRAVLLTCDGARVLLSLLLALAVLHGSLPLAYAALVVATVFAVFGDLAGATMIPRLLPDAALERANALMGVGQQLAFALGPVLAVLTITRFGPATAFLVDAASFALSLLVVSFAVRPEPPAAAEPGEQSGGLPALKALLHDIRAGWRFVFRSPTIGGLLAVVLLQTVGAGINSTVMLFFVTGSLGHKATDVAWLGTCNGIAQIAVGGTLVAFGHRTRWSKVLLSSVVAMAVGSLVVATAPSLWVLILGVIVTSLGNAPFNVANDTGVQRFVPRVLLARVRGTADVSMTLVYLLGASAAGWSVAAVGARGLLFVSAGASMFTVLLVLTFWKAFRRSEMKAARENSSVVNGVLVNKMT